MHEHSGGVMLAAHSMSLGGSEDGGGGGARRETGPSRCLKSDVVVAEVMQMRRSVQQSWTRLTEGTLDAQISRPEPT